jgi:hypothetical protein
MHVHVATNVAIEQDAACMRVRRQAVSRETRIPWTRVCHGYT